MSVLIVCGRFGSGKSTYLKTNFLNRTKKKKRAFALEKQDFVGIKCETDFIKMIMESTGVTDTLYVIDESAVAIPREQPDPANPKKIFDKKLISWFLNARKYNNFIVLVFHSLSDIPTWLLKYVKWFIRFATNDQLNYQRNRFISFPALIKSIDEEGIIKENFVYDEIKINSN